ncbi:MAG: pilus assembly protein PilM [Suilimivivens sp.]
MGKILSVYVENEGMRVCEVAKSSGNIVVKNAFEVPLPSGTVEDGMIHDVEDAAKTLYAALKNNRIKRGKIAFVISSKRIANKEIVIPYMKNQKKIDEIIKANVDEYFPMNNLEDYIFRYTILDTFENAEGKHISVLVMAFQKQMVESYYQLASMMKMPVITVDYYGNSMYQLLKKQLNQGTVLAIQMDRNMSNVSIMKGKAQVFKRSIPYGRNTVIRNLAELKGMTEEEAEDILSDPRKLDMELTPDEYSEVIRDFSSSITRVVEFHTTRNPGTTIELVKLMGSGIDLIGFPQVLGRELGIDVTIIKEVAGVKIAKKNSAGLNYENIVDYLPGIGALIQSLDLKVEEEKKKTGSYTIFVILIVLAALSVGGTIGFLIWSTNALTEQKQNLQAKLDRYGTAEATYNEYLVAKKNYDVVKNYYDSTRNPSEMTYQMILDLEKVMPESVGIIDISIKNGSVEMTGISDGKDSLAKFVIELKKLPYVTNVRVDDILDTNAELGGKTSNFNMKWQLIFPAEQTEGEAQAEDGTQFSVENGGTE